MSEYIGMETNEYAMLQLIAQVLGIATDHLRELMQAEQGRSGGGFAERRNP